MFKVKSIRDFNKRQVQELNVSLIHKNVFESSVGSNFQ